MHESGMIQKLVRTALEEAERRGGRLTAIDIRLGALAGGSAAHLREHFEHECQRRGLQLALELRAQPDYPGGVEITGLTLREPDPAADLPRG